MVCEVQKEGRQDAQVESDYADVLASSFPELHFYTEMPKVALRSNYIGYNICNAELQTSIFDTLYFFPWCLMWYIIIR